jgi:hypothetical protein
MSYGIMQLEAHPSTFKENSTSRKPRLYTFRQHCDYYASVLFISKEEHDTEVQITDRSITY